MFIDPNIINSTFFVLAIFESESCESHIVRYMKVSDYKFIIKDSSFYGYEITIMHHIMAYPGSENLQNNMSVYSIICQHTMSVYLMSLVT